MEGIEKRSLRPVVAFAIALSWLLASPAPPASAYEDEFGNSTQWEEWVEGGYRDPLVFSGDIVAAANLTGSDQILTVGEFGTIGLLTIDGGDAKMRVIESEWSEDLVSVAALDDGGAVLGSATGTIFLYNSDGTVEKGPNIHEFNDSILGLGVESDAAGKTIAVWAGGARGVLAKSTDRGRTWESKVPDGVIQAPMFLSDPGAGRRYLGIGNIDPESFVFDARVGGRRVEEGRDYEITYEDGVIEILNDLDAQPAPNLSFKFAPGPPFQAGDFTTSTVVTQGTVVTMAGEFGLILQTTDSGASWNRLNGKIHRDDPAEPYWIGGVSEGSDIILTGAGGAISRSSDGGVTWTRLTQPSGDAGVFGAHLDGDKVVVVGAVGMLADYSGNGEWTFADRSRLSVYSWLKTLLTKDGRLVGLGGRGNCVYRESGDWERCTVRIVENEG